MLKPRKEMERKRNNGQGQKFRQANNPKKKAGHQEEKESLKT